MTYLDHIKEKVLERENLDDWVQIMKDQEQSMVFTNGCFDLIHLGHIDYLSKAADLADALIIGVNSDHSVQRLKGPNRPLQDQVSRAHILAALEFVDAVVVFDEDTPLNLINTVKPDILVKGGDYTVETVVGAKEVQAYGGRVELIPFLEGYSTSSIEAKIKGRR